LFAKADFGNDIFKLKFKKINRIVEVIGNKREQIVM